MVQNLRCQRCDHAGVPQKTEAGGGKTTVYLRCPECGHTWAVQHADESPFARAVIESF